MSSEVTVLVEPYDTPDGELLRAEMVAAQVGAANSVCFARGLG
ncbi:hypothetical protein [Conexibacter sp. CPCC 206217]|nr:hypothetical protein [Conexibacter sp. CPCC 206217]MDO8211807.1 hypothetical protein [Conexibacter sp. CPCC 206217]